MALQPPALDRRKFEELLREALAMAAQYAPEWDAQKPRDAGSALLRIYLPLWQQVQSRLNQLPLKHRLAFLDKAGIRLLPAQPARTWLRFTLSEGALQPVSIPRGAECAGLGQASPTESREVGFQTEEPLRATSAKLLSFFSVLASEDSIFRHSGAEGPVLPILPWRGESRQEHAFYLGHADQLNMAAPSRIEISFAVTSPAERRLQLVWEYWNAERWVPIDLADAGNPAVLFEKSGTVILEKRHAAEIAEAEIMGKTSRWIRCRAKIPLSASMPLSLPEFDAVEMSVSSLSPLVPDLGFYNSIPLDLAEVKTEVVPWTYPLSRDLDGDIVVLESDAWPAGFESPRVVSFPITFRLGDGSDIPARVEELVQVEKSRRHFRLDRFLPLDVKEESGTTAVEARSAAIQLPGTHTPLILAVKRAYVVAKLAKVEGITVSDTLRFVNFRDIPREGAEVTGVSDSGREVSIGPRTRPAPRSPGERGYDAGDLVMREKAVGPGDSMVFLIGLPEGFELPEGRRIAIDDGDGTTRLFEKAAFAIEKDAAGNPVGRLALKGDPVEVRPGQRIRFIPDLKPLGDVPRLLDTFYLASDEAFSKRGAEVVVTFEFKTHAPPTSFTGLVPDKGDIKPLLQWEYFSTESESWRKLGVLDGTDRFLVPPDSNSEFARRDLAFTCPDDIGKTTVNDEEKYWIRARLLDGDYGRPFVTREETITVATGTRPEDTKELRIVTTRAGHVHYPVLSDIRIQYADAFRIPQHVLAANNGVFADHTVAAAPRNLAFRPFVQLPESRPCLFLGFDKALVGGPLRILWEVREQIVPSDRRVKLEWSFWNGRAWEALQVKDGSEALTQIGAMEWVGRESVERNLFGDSRHWMKAELALGTHPAPVSIDGVHLNVARSLQSDSVRDENLGSSSGLPDLGFELRNRPIISQEVRVREPSPPDDEEKAALLAEEGEGAIGLVRDEKGEVTEIWVRWHAVEDFDMSGPRSRHYLVDHREGRIGFGDGTRGMVPPKGVDNIRCSYRFGGGAIGNVAAGAVKQLKRSIPFVGAVVNPMRADGGSEAETVDAAQSRGPAQLKHRNRAVAREDYEWMAKAASRKVARAVCLPGTNAAGDREPGWISVLIVPEDPGDKPVPSNQLIDTVREFLLSSCSHAVAGRRSLDVRAVEYLEVRVEAELVPAGPGSASEAENGALTRLQELFHPLRGGAGGEGWEFGRAICRSEILAALQSLPAVDRVLALRIFLAGSLVAGSAALPEGCLPFSGSHRIGIVPPQEEVPGEKALLATQCPVSGDCEEGY